MLAVLTIAGLKHLTAVSLCSCLTKNAAAQGPCLSSPRLGVSPTAFVTAVPPNFKHDPQTEDLGERLLHPRGSPIPYRGRTLGGALLRPAFVIWSQNKSPLVGSAGFSRVLGHAVSNRCWPLHYLVLTPPVAP